jgi:hypothetical protein
MSGASNTIFEMSPAVTNSVIIAQSPFNLVTIDGITVQKGYRTGSGGGGGGILYTDGSNGERDGNVNIFNCIIQSNRCDGMGGGISISHSGGTNSTIISNCVFRGNFSVAASSVYGAALYSIGGVLNGSIVDCIIEDTSSTNDTTGTGATIYLSAGQNVWTIDRCIIRNNRTSNKHGKCFVQELFNLRQCYVKPIGKFDIISNRSKRKVGELYFCK